ncbi:MAG: hypothetical protein V1882_10075 [Candidatus Omnitrophota bacterium]
MKEFMVGLLVIVMALILSGIGIILFPILLMLGLFLRFAVGLLILLLAIWMIGKATLFLIDAFKKKETKQV